jgi:hypothetical protein
VGKDPQPDSTEHAKAHRADETDEREFDFVLHRTGLRPSAAQRRHACWRPINTSTFAAIRAPFCPSRSLVNFVDAVIERIGTAESEEGSI